MKRAFTRFLMVALTPALLTSPVHAAHQGRTAVEPYYGPMIGTVSTPGFCSSQNHSGCIKFPRHPGERAVSFSVQYISRLPVYAAVGQWVLTGPDPYIREKDMVFFCGQTTRPFRIDPKKGDLMVFIFDASGPVPGCPGLGTAGDVVATFSR